MQKWKHKLLGLAGTVVMTAGMAMQAYAMDEKEGNDKKGDADKFSLEDTIYGKIGNPDDDDYFKFEMDKTGRVTIAITPEMKYYTLQLRNSSDKLLFEKARKESNGKDTYTFDLEVDTYYLMVSGNDTTGSYVIHTDFDSSNATETEKNSSFDTANSFRVGDEVCGMISMTDEYDYYKFTVSETNKVTFNVRSYVGSFIFRLYGGDREKIDDSEDVKISSGEKYRDFSKSYTLKAGTYYICCTNSGDTGAYTGKYSISTKTSASNYTEKENNGSLEQANAYTLGNEIRGTIDNGDEYDYYKFTADRDANLNVHIESEVEKYSVRLFDADGKRIQTWDMDRGSKDRKVDDYNYDLKKGTYYICFTNRERTDYHGDYLIHLCQDGQSNPGPTNPSEEKITGFVERMYSYCLGRPADPDGRIYWVNLLKTGAKTGAEVAEEFIFSFESTKREQSNEEFVKLLYLTMMDRNPEENGFRYWTDLLNSGQKTRYQVAAGFIDSDEFKGICSNYGINRGSINGDAVAPIEKFVARFYQLALERTPEQAGMYYWVARLKNHQDNGATVAEKFFFSDEMLAKHNSNEKYIELLYSVMMDRQADGNGKAYWLDKMDTNRQNYMSRREVLNGFIISDEFTGICRNFNIERGSLY